MDVMAGLESLIWMSCHEDPHMDVLSSSTPKAWLTDCSKCIKRCRLEKKEATVPEIIIAVSMFYTNT